MYLPENLRVDELLVFPCRPLGVSNEAQFMGYYGITGDFSSLGVMDFTVADTTLERLTPRRRCMHMSYDTKKFPLEY